MGPLVIHRGPAPAPTPTACFRPGRFCWILTGKRVCAQPLQSCLTLCDPVDCSPPGSSVYGILQVKILELVAMPSSRGSPLIRRLNLYLLHWQVGSLPTKPPGKLYAYSLTYTNTFSLIFQIHNYGMHFTVLPHFLFWR